MKKKHIFGMLVLVLISTLGAAMVFAGNFKNALSHEERETLSTAVANDDFETWKSIKEDRISQERFDERTNRHTERAEFRSMMLEAKEQGNYERVQELKDEFGMGKGNHRRAMSSECPFN